MGCGFLARTTPNAVCSPALGQPDDRAAPALPRRAGGHPLAWTTTSAISAPSIPHWAQRLQEAGYRTGYFGKWHVERSNDLRRFRAGGVDGGSASPLFKERQRASGAATKDAGSFSLRKTDDHPPGYDHTLLYGVTDVPPERRGVGVTTALARDFLQDAVDGDDPWCCFVSVTEPHDPFVTGEAAYARYDADALPLQPERA